MTQIKELEKALLTELSKHVGKYDFDTKVRGQSFYKQMPFGRLAFHLSFIKHKTDFDATVDVAVRFDDLEDLINQYRGRISEAQKKNTFTLGAELGNLSEGRQKRWTVATLDDIKPVAESIMDAFVLIGLPYLEKYSNMKTTLETLSGDDSAAWLHAPIHDDRAKLAIALAFLLGDRERFSKLAAAKTEFLESRKDPGLQSFMQLRDALKHRFDGLGSR